MTAVWKYKQFESTKLKVAQELNQIQSECGMEERTIHALEKIAELENSNHEGQLTRLILIFSTLSQHVQFNTLSYNEAKGLFDLAHTLLLVHRVPNDNSKLSVLFGDFHTLKSLFAEKEGHFWQSIWQLNLSILQSPASNSGGEIYQKHLYATKAMRLGNTKLSQFYLDCEVPSDHPMYGYFAINRIRTARLAGDLAKATALAEQIERENVLSEQFQKDLVWENHCIAVAKSHDVSPLSNLMTPEQGYYKASYLVEYLLWCYGSPSFKAMFSFPKLRTLVRKKDLNIRGTGEFYKIAKLLESGYDKSVPLVTRMQKVEEMFNRIKKLRTLDKELLCWLALSRLLDRESQEDMVAIALSEYKALSQRLSLGNSSDVLGLACDLLQKYQDRV